MVSSQHPSGGDPAAPVMWTVVAALLPAATVGVFYFGIPALVVLVAATAECVAFEALFLRLIGRPAALFDGRAALTGLLLGMNLPPASPGWMVAAGCAVAILFGRLLFPGLGFNPFTPALAARIVLLTAFPVRMTTWSPPVGLFVSAPATVTAVGDVDVLDALIGRIPGSVGETSAIALGLGGAFLLRRGIITWHVPVFFLGSVAAIAAVFSAIDPARFPGAGFHLVTGGLILGAIFMTTDYVTAPATPRGVLIYGAGCGALTWLIRSFGSYTEAVSFAILLMNMLRPLIDMYTRPSPAGVIPGGGP